MGGHCAFLLGVWSSRRRGGIMIWTRREFLRGPGRRYFSRSTPYISVSSCYSFCSLTLWTVPCCSFLAQVFFMAEVSILSPFPTMFSSWRKSQIQIVRGIVLHAYMQTIPSSPTEANTVGSLGCHETSLTDLPGECCSIAKSRASLSHM